MSSKNNKKDKETLIFWAACRVIRQKGFHQSRMADIAKEAGISYGLVYHYYKNKSDLFDALIKEWWFGLNKLTDSLIDQPLTVEEKLEAIVLYFLEQYEQREDLVHIFITELSRSTANLTPKRLKPFKALMNQVENIIRQAQEEGTMRTDLKSRYLSRFFLGSLEGLLSTMVLEGSALKSEEHKNRLTHALLTLFMNGARSTDASVVKDSDLRSRDSKQAAIL